MNFNEPYLVADRIRKIKIEIKYIQNKIDLNKRIISKFEKLPSNIKNGLDENTSNKILVMIIKDKSFFKNFLSMIIFENNNETPKTINKLKIFDPTTFPTDNSGEEFNAETIETLASGAEVPHATIVNPIIIDGILIFLANKDALSTNKSAPLIKTNKPRIKEIIKIIICHTFSNL